MKLLEEYIIESLCGLGSGRIFFSGTRQVWVVKKVDFSNMETICSSKDTAKETELHVMDWGKAFGQHTPDEELAYRTGDESYGLV